MQGMLGYKLSLCQQVKSNPRGLLFCGGAQGFLIERQSETAKKKMAEYWDKLDAVEKDIVTIMGSRSCITATELSVMVSKTRRTVNKKLSHLLEIGVIKMNGNKHDPSLTCSLNM